MTPRVLPLAAAFVLSIIAVSRADVACNTTPKTADPPAATAPIVWPSTPAAAISAIDRGRLAEHLPPIELQLPATYAQAPEERKVIMLMNAERTVRGWPVINNIQSENDPILGYIAENHSRVVAQHPALWGMPATASEPWPTTHYNAIDGSPDERVRGIPGYTSGSVNINSVSEVMAVNDSPEGAVWNWMYGDALHQWGHRHIVLTCIYQHAGVGVATDKLLAAAFSWPPAKLYTVNFVAADQSYRMLTAGTAKPTPPTVNIQMALGRNSKMKMDLEVTLHDVYGIPNKLRGVYVWPQPNWGKPYNDKGNLLGYYPFGNGGTECPAIQGDNSVTPSSNYTCDFPFSGVPAEVIVIDIFGATARIGK